MGIPTFYQWLLHTYPSTITRSSHNPTTNLYIDLNGILHSFFSCPSPSFSSTFSSLFTFLTSLILTFPPSSLLFLAVDGVAPRAKMTQQRSRRYNHSRKSSCEQISELLAKGLSYAEIYESVSLFDANCISPGTAFQEELSRYMKQFINDMSALLGKEVRIVYSDAAVPGEGEHKIFAYMRRERIHDTAFGDKVHAVYGVDADLIMLALLLHEPNVMIIRPSNVFSFAKESKCSFDVVHMKTLRRYFKEEYSEVILKCEYNIERLIDDFVLICVFIGNDFIPGLPLLHIHQGAISEVIYLHKQCCIHFTQNTKLIWHITKDDGNININNMHMFISKLSQVHSHKLNEIRAHVLSPQELHNERIKYYSSKFHMTSPTEDLIHHISSSYITTLCWVFHYYYNGVPSWEWYYPYHYAPYASDLAMQCEVYQYKKFALGEPVCPYEQLLMILPPWSAHCLPRNVGRLMLDIESPLIDMYPWGVKFDRNGMKYEWMGVNVIPFVDARRVRKEVKEVMRMGLWDEEEKRRNRFMQSYVVQGMEWGIVKEENMWEERKRSWNRGKDIEEGGGLKEGERWRFCGDEARRRIDKCVTFDEEEDEDMWKWVIGEIEEEENKKFLNNKRKKD